MTPSILTILLTFVTTQEVDLAGLKSSELVLDRVTGPPPLRSHYLSEDSGAKVRRINRKTIPGLNLFFNITSVLPNSTELIIRLYEGHNNAYKSLLAEYKPNFCDYLASEHRPIFRTMKDVLNLPRSCPVKPAIFKVDNWQISKYLPPVLPFSESFKLLVALNFEREDNIILKVFFRASRK